MMWAAARTSAMFEERVWYNQGKLHVDGSSYLSHSPCGKRTAGLSNSKNDSYERFVTRVCTDQVIHEASTRMGRRRRRCFESLGTWLSIKIQGVYIHSQRPTKEGALFLSRFNPSFLSHNRSFLFLEMRSRHLSPLPSCPSRIFLSFSVTLRL